MVCWTLFKSNRHSITHKAAFRITVYATLFVRDMLCNIEYHLLNRKMPQYISYMYVAFSGTFGQLGLLILLRKEYHSQGDELSFLR